MRIVVAGARVVPFNSPAETPWVEIDLAHRACERVDALVGIGQVVGGAMLAVLQCRTS